MLYIGYKTEEGLGECHQIGELLLVVTGATLVGGALLREEGNEPIRCTLLALDNVLECDGGRGGQGKWLIGRLVTPGWVIRGDISGGNTADAHGEEEREARRGGPIRVRLIYGSV